MSTSALGGSASIAHPDYWWYRVRSGLLQTVLEPHVGTPERVLDVGSADGPSVAWMREHGTRIALDVDPRGLEPGDVCGSALELPFRDETFDVAAAFDVVEHCEPEHQALGELARVLRPGGRLLMSVPAYQWAWTDFDVQNGHHRRYTKKRAVDAVTRAGLRVERATYAFAGVFPIFTAQRLVDRARARVRGARHGEAADVVSLPQVGPGAERVLLGLSRLDQALLPRTDLPVGSSVLIAAVKPEA